MFIKGVAFVAEELSTEQLRLLKKGNTVTLGVTPDREPQESFVIKVRISATDHQKAVTRVEGNTIYNEKRAEVIAILSLQGESYVQLISYS